MKQSDTLFWRVEELLKISLFLYCTGVLTAQRASRLSIRKWELLNTYELEFGYGVVLDTLKRVGCGWCVHSDQGRDCMLCKALGVCGVSGNRVKRKGTATILKELKKLHTRI